MTAGTLPSALKSDALAAASGWAPGSPAARHNEIFGSGKDASAAAVALAFARDGMQAEDRRSILWVQDRNAIRLTGRPYRQGLPAELRSRLIHVAAKTPEDALFALEEGLRCRELACVIGELAGNPRALGLTASRRLSLAAERYGVPLFLIRLDAERDLSSARMRWDVRSATSPPKQWNPEAPGTPSWRAELFRARGYRQGEWILRDDGTALIASSPDHGDLVAAAGDRPLAAY